MPRSLKTRKPRAVEVRQLHALLEDELTARQRRRAEAIVLHAAGLEAAEIARALEVHVNTVYSDLRAFAQGGVVSIRQRLRGGAPVRISTQQTAEILRLAETPFGQKIQMPLSLSVYGDLPSPTHRLDFPRAMPHTHHE